MKILVLNGLKTVDKKKVVAIILVLIRQKTANHWGVMNKLSCPRCDNAFYSAAKESQMPCPYCGFVLKAQDSDRRNLGRISTQQLCDILKGEVRIPVKTVDVSDTGLGIKMVGYLPFEKDETVDIYIHELDIEKKARVIWTKKFYGISRAGLCFDDAPGHSSGQ